MKKKIIFLVAAALMLNSCDDLFEPAIENFKDVEQMYDDAQYAQGFLVNVYRGVPGYYDNSEYATDDAVINQKNNAFLTMATGLPGYGRLSINGPIRSVLSSISIFSWKMWIR